jgi:hypothetical protein
MVSVNFIHLFINLIHALKLSIPINSAQREPSQKFPHRLILSLDWDEDGFLIQNSVETKSWNFDEFR